MRILQVVTPQMQEPERVTAAEPSVVDFQQAFDAALAPLRTELQAVQERVESLPKELPAPTVTAPAEPLPDPRVDALHKQFVEIRQQLDILEQGWQIKFNEIQTALDELKAGTKNTAGTFNTAGTESTSGIEKTAGTEVSGDLNTAGTFETAGPAVSKVPDVRLPESSVPDVPSAPAVSSVPAVSLVPASSSVPDVDLPLVPAVSSAPEVPSVPDVDLPLIPDMVSGADDKPSVFRRVWSYLNETPFKK